MIEYDFKIIAFALVAFSFLDYKNNFLTSREAEKSKIKIDIPLRFSLLNIL